MKEVITRPGEIVIETGSGVIVCYALGSSLGICLYDATKQIGGFVNSLLPQHPNNRTDLKYVNNAILSLYQKMLEHGCQRENIISKIIGGAQLFTLENQNNQHSIGKDNIKVAHQVLMSLQIPIVSEDVGDTYGRTMYFNIEDGRIYIETRNENVYYV